MARIVFEAELDAPVDRAVPALTTADGIAAWWTDDVHLAGDGPGGLLRLGFPVAPLPFELRIEEAGPKRVRWASVGEFPPHWVGTEIVWTLSAAGDGSRSTVHFAHDGWASDDGPLPVAAFTWGELLGVLKSYLETGAGGPLFHR